MTDNVVPFPPRLRVVSAPKEYEPMVMVPPAMLVEHGGRTYRLEELTAALSPSDLREIEATAPRSAQAAWDEVVRRWPALADLIVAGCGEGG